MDTDYGNSDSRKKRVRKFCEARKIKASQILHKIISTHLLTVLTTGVIVWIEQDNPSDKEACLPVSIW